MRNPFAIRAEPRLARARLGVFGYFGTCGLVFGMWVAQLPALDERMHLGTARIGTALLLIAAGALAAMPVAGRLCDRLDSRRVARVAGPVSALSLLGPALASDYGVLLVFGAVFGVGCGMLEVSMNVNSVEVEARYGRPIVSAFHGAWSLGGAIGGALTAAGLHAGVDARAMLVAAAVSCPVFYLLAGRPLLPPPTSPDRRADSGGGRALRWGAVLLLGVVAFSGHLSEGAAVDWSAIHAHLVLDVDLAAAPLAYTVFGVTMTAVRLLGDPIRGRLGAARTLLLSGLCAAAGYVFVLVAPAAGAADMAVGCFGWALAGVGLATVVPVVFSAVGAAGGAVGSALSVVTAFGSAGLLAGPAVIGYAAEFATLPIALVIPGVLALVVAAGGLAVRTPHDAGDRAATRDRVPEAV